jgi:tRNA(Ile)-lysidine synthase
MDTVLTNPDRWTAYLDADQLGPHLALRRRRPGDRFQPLGMGGQNVEVADLMINAKIPRQWRKHIPLLVHHRPGGAGEGEIAWLVGWRIDERVKITDRTRRLIRLRLLRSEIEEGAKA